MCMCDHPSLDTTVVGYYKETMYIYMATKVSYIHASSCHINWFTKFLPREGELTWLTTTGWATVVAKKKKKKIVIGHLPQAVWHLFTISVPYYIIQAGMNVGKLHTALLITKNLGIQDRVKVMRHCIKCRWLSGCRSSVAEHWPHKPGILGLISDDWWPFQFPLFFGSKHLNFFNVRQEF